MFQWPGNMENFIDVFYKEIVVFEIAEKKYIEQNSRKQNKVFSVFVKYFCYDIIRDDRSSQNEKVTPVEPCVKNKRCCDQPQFGEQCIPSGKQKIDNDRNRQKSKNECKCWKKHFIFS